jgi:hypothetical protein
MNSVGDIYRYATEEKIAFDLVNNLTKIYENLRRKIQGDDLSERLYAVELTSKQNNTVDGTLSANHLYSKEKDKITFFIKEVYLA